MSFMELQVPTKDELDELVEKYPDIPTQFFESGAIHFKTGIIQPRMQVEVIQKYIEDPSIPLRRRGELHQGISHTSCSKILKRAERAGLIDMKQRDRTGKKVVQRLKQKQDEYLVRRMERADKRASANEDLADQFEQFARSGMSELNQRDLSAEKTTDIMKAVSTATERMRLLRDEATKKVVNESHTLVEHVAYIDALDFEEQMKLAHNEPIEMQINDAESVGGEIEDAEVIKKVD